MTNSYFIFKRVSCSKHVLPRVLFCQICFKRSEKNQSQFFVYTGIWIFNFKSFKHHTAKRKCIVIHCLEEDCSVVNLFLGQTLLPIYCGDWIAFAPTFRHRHCDDDTFRHKDALPPRCFVAISKFSRLRNLR